MFGQFDKRTSTASKEVTPEKKMSKIYLVWSIVGSLLHCLSTFIRGIESADPLTSKFTISLAYVVIGSSALCFNRYKKGNEF